jgi:hypothetical protein
VAEIGDRIRTAASDGPLIRSRVELAQRAANVFGLAGRDLYLMGHIIGPDRVAGRSPWGHGTDETVAVSVLLRMASQLVSASADLFQDGRHYAAAALLRQIVEIEYLAWAMETRDRDGERWLRSDRAERETFFRPAKLREASEGRFRGKDYGYHCELGGHPVPGANVLLGDDAQVAQILVADLLGHTGRIWDHLVGWATRSDQGEPISKRAPELSEAFAAWKSEDPLARLGPPPDAT